MNKQQLTATIAEQNRIPMAQAERIIDSITETIKRTVKSGDDVKLVGFGTFVKYKRKARMGRNPQTGVSIKIPAAWHAKFRPGTEFKNMVN